MKSIRIIALSAILTIGAFSAVTYTSCSKDDCKGVTCLNGGTCSGGKCSCKSGLGGDNCETIYRNNYAKDYSGSGTDNTGGTYANFKLRFTTGTDTADYTKMQLAVVTSSGANYITVPIVLSSNTTSGSAFTVTSTTIDSFTYTGSGTVNGSTATFTMTEATPHAPATIYTFANFIKM